MYSKQQINRVPIIFQPPGKTTKLETLQVGKMPSVASAVENSWEALPQLEWNTYQGPSLFLGDV